MVAGRRLQRLGGADGDLSGCCLYGEVVLVSRMRSIGEKGG